MIETTRQVRPPEAALNVTRSGEELPAGTVQKDPKDTSAPDPEIRLERPLSEVVKIDPKTFTEIRFVKNLNPRERLVLKDGSRFTFPGQFYICKDPDLARKILEIADSHNIVIQ